MSCQCKGIEDEFSGRVARRELRSYRKKGPRGTTRQLIDSVRAAANDPKSLLDIGGGVGAIQHELAKDGLSSVTNVDASTAYLAAAREEAERLSLTAERSYLQGDFVALADQVSDADIVTLDRVLCCYDDVEQLVIRSAAKAKQAYGLVYPTVTW
ncbi:MAG: class I SAM-dependent methyltransferase, partial [Rhodothermales bacterium]|nr:class I SAM-dependent methyltransferase [Rhodothermales bacterium]